METITLTLAMKKSILKELGDQFYFVSDFEYGDTFKMSVTEVKKSPYSANFFGKVLCRGKKSGDFYALVDQPRGRQVRDFQVFLTKKELDYHFRLNTARSPRRD